MNRFTPALAAALFCISAGMAYAQAPSGDAGKGPGMMGPGGEHRMMKPCSQEADPAKCEARRKEMREHMKAAYESCKSNADKRGCMTQQMCAKAPDPAKCQANAKERQQKHMQGMDEHQKAAEACTGKRGDELMRCMHEQHPRRKPDAK
jgi:Spy/CpxP family protein refolding chaperone